LGASFDWDANPADFPGLPNGRVQRHFCGGTEDLAVNASMPNALVSLNRLLDPQRPDIAALKARMLTFLGCDGPKGDPVFPRK